jgi:pimeloyl-ACP methyl ester carboxylesterase
MAEFNFSETRYAQIGNISIAYQVIGRGPFGVVVIPGLFSHIEFQQELPGYMAFFRGLARYARVAIFDKRGQGLSDRMAGAPSLEERMDDVRAVMDAVGLKRTALLGFSEGGPMSTLFAATYPERVSHLILVGGYARAVDRMKEEVFQASVEQLIKHWGAGQTIKLLAPPSQATNPEAIAWFAKFERLSSSPGALRTLMQLNRRIDVTAILPSLHVPTLVLHGNRDQMVSVELGRKLAKDISGARYIEYPNGDHYLWLSDPNAFQDDIEEFITGERQGASMEFERVLATVLFTDIVGSTRLAVEEGDRRWRKLLDEHDQLAQQIVIRHRGNLVKSTGDGILATFDGPGRAVRCALAFGSAAQRIGLPLRAGVHTGEIEVRGKDIGGVAVHVAARVMAKSAPNEVLVSRVVTDLVAGAGLKFAERGSHELKGLPGRWDLYVAS